MKPGRLLYLFPILLSFALVYYTPVSAQTPTPTPTPQPTWNTVYSWRSWQSHPTYDRVGQPVKTILSSSTNVIFDANIVAPPGETAPAGAFSVGWGGNGSLQTRSHHFGNGTTSGYTFTGNPFKFFFYGQKPQSSGTIQASVQDAAGNTLCSVTQTGAGLIALTTEWGWSTAHNAVFPCLVVGETYFFYFTYETSTSNRMFISAFEIREHFVLPPPPTPTPPPNFPGVPITGTCVINSGGISSTIPANIVPNWSYETGQTIPNSWSSPDVPSNIPAMWQRNQLDAAHGENYITAPATSTTYQTSVNPANGRWLVGFYGRGSGSFDYQIVSDLETINQTANISSTAGAWQVNQMVLNITNSGGDTGGAQSLRLLMEPGDYAIDAVFMIPVTYTAGITNTGLPTDTAGLSVYCPNLNPPPSPTSVDIDISCSFDDGTRPANVIANHSFETGDVIPDNWFSTDNPSRLPGMWKQDGKAAHGNNYITSPGFDFSTEQMNYQIRLPANTNESDLWLVGLYAKGEGSVQYAILGPDYSSSQTQFLIDSPFWQNKEFVANVANPVIFGFYLGVGDYDIDRIYMIPVTYTAGITNTGLYTDTAGLVVNCPTSIGGGGGGEGTTPGGWTGNGAYCTTCPLPSNLLNIGLWISWLGCVLTNLFFCWVASWVDSIIALGLSIFAFMGSGINALMVGINQALAWLGMVWDVVIYVTEDLWGYFAQLLAWLADAVYSVALWVWGIGQTIWGVYIPTTIARLWVFAIWVGDGVNAVIGWVWDSGSSALVWLWEVGAYGVAWLLEGMAWLWANLDPLTLLIWLLNLPPIQALLSAGMGGYIVLEAMGIAVGNLSAALVELWELLIIVVNAFRGVFAADDYVIILNTNGAEIETVDPGALGASGMNGTKMLWLGLSAIATADYMVEIFPLEIPLIMTIGILAWGIGAWTLSQWKEIINW